MFIPGKNDEQNRIPRPDHYVLYGWRQSYFTRKLQAALHFYEAPYEFVRKDVDNERELLPFPSSTAFARFVVSEMTGTYLPFALGNRQALEAGAKAFVIPIYGEDVSYLARPYVEQSRRMILQRINTLLTDEERARVLAWLDEEGLIEVFR